MHRVFSWNIWFSCFYISSFALTKSIFKPFMPPTCFYKRTLQSAVFVKTKNKLFFKYVTFFKNVSRLIFDKRFCCFYIGVFVWAKSIFLAFSHFLVLFIFFYRFFTKTNYEGLWQFLHSQISQMKHKNIKLFFLQSPQSKIDWFTFSTTVI